MNMKTDKTKIYNFINELTKKISKNDVEVSMLTKNEIRTIVANSYLDNDYILMDEEPKHYYNHYDSVLNKLKKDNLYFEIAEINSFDKVEKISLVEFDGRKFKSIENLPCKRAIKPLTEYKAISYLNKSYNELFDKDLSL